MALIHLIYENNKKMEFSYIKYLIMEMNLIVSWKEFGTWKRDKLPQQQKRPKYLYSTGAPANIEPNGWPPETPKNNKEIIVERKGWWYLKQNLYDAYEVLNHSKVLAVNFVHMI